MTQTPVTPPVTGTTNIAVRRQRPSLEPIITHMRKALMPLHPLPAGPPHPAFPLTVLAYHLLTEAQMNSIASYYHQRPITPNSLVRPFEQSYRPHDTRASRQVFPSIWTGDYPAPIDWDDEFMDYIGQLRGTEARLSMKRRKIGKFMGLRGCLTPVDEAEERERWLRRRERLVLKGDEFSFIGRRGYWN